MVTYELTYIVTYELTYIVTYELLTYMAMGRVIWITNEDGPVM